MSIQIGENEKKKNLDTISLAIRETRENLVYDLFATRVNIGRASREQLTVLSIIVKLESMHSRLLETRETSLPGAFRGQRI